MAQTRWSPAVVHAAAQAPFGRALGRYPAPVWTLGLWLGLSLFNVGIRLAVTPPSGATFVVNLAVAAYLLLCLGVIATLGPVVPEWFLWIQPIAGVAYLSLLTFTAPSLMSVATTAWGFEAATIYAALWFTRRYMVMLIGAMVVAYPVALALGGSTSEVLGMSATVIVSCGGVGLLLQYLINSLRTDAVVDPLTGLLNRRGLQVAIAMGESAGRIVDPRSLVVIDLDGFKTVNDERGHEAGARVLMERIAAGSPVTLSYGIANWSSRTAFDAAAREADVLMYAHKEERRGPLT